MTIARRIPAFIGVVLAFMMLAGCTTGRNPEIVPAPTFAARPPVEKLDPVAQYASDRLSTMSLRHKVMSMLMVHVPDFLCSSRPIRRVESFVVYLQTMPLLPMNFVRSHRVHPLRRSLNVGHYSSQ